MPAGPPPRVLDLFVVPDVVQALPGGQGGSVRAGDLVLSPGRDAAVCEWLNPMLARLAVRLDERSRRALRIAMPVPARDGSWVVDGWAASRWEPGTTRCRDAEVVLATGRLLHAELAVACPAPPVGLDRRTDRWAIAEREAFAPAAGEGLGPDQLVHADLARNVLLDAQGVPVVIDLAPAWRPARWAEAVCVLDLVADGDAELAVVTDWSHGPAREAMERALAFRERSDPESGSGYSGVRTMLDPSHGPDRSP